MEVKILLSELKSFNYFMSLIFLLERMDICLDICNQVQNMWISVPIPKIDHGPCHKQGLPFPLQSLPS